MGEESMTSPPSRHDAEKIAKEWLASYNIETLPEYSVMARALLVAVAALEKIADDDTGIYDTHPQRAGVALADIRGEEKR